MEPGPPLRAVAQSLGLQEGKYFLLRRSNLRHEVQLVVRTLHSGIAGRAFPELLWVLSARRKILIYCATIKLGYNVTKFLWNSASGSLEERAIFIRMYNSLNWPSYNQETWNLMLTDPKPQVRVATDALSVGINLPHIQDVIIVGEPRDVNDVVQKIGRAGRDWKMVKDARGIIYVSSSTMAKAALVAGQSLGNAPAMIPSLASFLTAACLPTALDSIYNNPSSNPPCFCLSCVQSDKPGRPITCHCSRCIPETLPTRQALNEAKRKSRKEGRKRSMKDHALAGDQRQQAEERLRAWRQRIWAEADEVECGFIPSYAFFPDHLITHFLLRTARSITSE